MSKIRKKPIRLKSFGIFEAMIASVVVILILTSAVALSASSNRVASKNETYSFASQIADQFLEQITFGKSVGKVRFDQRAGDGGAFPIECFISNVGQRAAAICADATPFLPAALNQHLATDSPDVYTYKNTDNSSFPPGYFKYTATVRQVTSGWCYGPADSDRIIPGLKCRNVKIQVMWKDGAGDQSYVATEYFGDWEN